MPSVAPCTSWPRRSSSPKPVQPPARRSASAVANSREAAMINPKARSAVVSSRGSAPPGGSSAVKRTRAIGLDPTAAPNGVSADAEAARRGRQRQGVLLEEGPQEMVGEVDGHAEQVALVAVVVQPVGPPDVP